MQAAVAAQTAGFTETLLRANAELRQEVATLAGRVETLEAENIECRGENAQLHQILESLEQHLRRAGIAMPARRVARSFTVMEGGRVTTMTPDAPPSPRPKRRRSRKAAP